MNLGQYCFDLCWSLHCHEVALSDWLLSKATIELMGHGSGF